MATLSSFLKKRDELDRKRIPCKMSRWEVAARLIPPCQLPSQNFSFIVAPLLHIYTPNHIDPTWF